MITLMPTPLLRLLVTCASIVLCHIAAVTAQPAGSGPAVTYRLSFPEPEHRWMQVEVVFAGLESTPLQVRMSRTSPGRYALHEFAKNVFGVQAFDGRGREIGFARPNLHQWDIGDHDGTVRLVYKVFGDRIDGTYLSVDATHAHLNIPAALMWARDLEQRPARITFVQPEGRAWNVATQLFPSDDDPMTFTAPNLQYLLDSPAEFGGFVSRTFSAPGPTSAAQTFQIALHHDGTEAEVDRFARDVERIVEESVAIFGELPQFDGDTYVFLADYLPHADGDGMEHRNSTVLTSSGSLRANRIGLLGTVAHELFHAWNVERIRPQSLEPFDFEHANVSGELWLGEGFTSYYNTLILQRAELTDLPATLRRFAGLINTAVNSPGRQLRSAVEMSQLAPFVDAARSVDPTTWRNTFISYYTWGAAIGLGLDLALRDRSEGLIGLDDYMRAMWRVHGKPSGTVPGVVETPYTLADARMRLAEVSGDAAFADYFFTRYIVGREAVDYGPLLERAGLVLEKRSPGQASLGSVRYEYSSDGARLAASSPFGSPVYAAGLDRGDLLVSLDGEAIRSAEALQQVLERRRPGDQISVTFVRRGERVPITVTLVLQEDPELQIVEDRSLDAAERTFRASWLASKVPR